MVIDLRTAAEKRRVRRHSDIEVEVPAPIPSNQLSWLENTLVYIASAHPRSVFQVFCAKGNRSRVAAKILREHGFEVVDLGGVG